MSLTSWIAVCNVWFLLLCVSELSCNNRKMRSCCNPYQPLYYLSENDEGNITARKTRAVLELQR
jgi:hypothetical protein